jgi:hypothetical protein
VTVAQTPEADQLLDFLQGLLPEHMLVNIEHIADQSMQLWPEVSEADEIAMIEYADRHMLRLWGADFERKMAGARRLAHEIDEQRPGFVDFMRDHPQISYLPGIVARICMAAERKYTN